ncbi:Signal transduction histidine kinase [Streptoalloteichus tenebrarius]|uniref:histidine kinase n=1 Tax=Streptoalloteichus tenebrarius (strain ATCC 17920 / DSM 40477 / JCM 4838 / CBS 697.72 / NBRC 16177 / NCIMB 11028 / NRRL B-12390 / A12253. 1 / ISP 5477) TaxID=1933 RepID=A0ABT1I204_STRSD|nr:sensor histidine kinase [Streptoalloteichus tenebrarius]MCP2261812.1 Signal transduction histidine kinase [Streptoalloteichus tenebrarius]BFF02190.1 sensor histidine kinase [Streptoalloteichus tenebrarius]
MGHRKRRRHFVRAAPPLPRLVACLLLGAGSALVELVFLLLAGIGSVVAAALPWARPTLRRWFRAGARRLTEFERWRLAVFLFVETEKDGDDRRLPRYLAARVMVGLLGLGVLLLLALGLGLAVATLWAWLTDGTLDGGRVTHETVLWLLLPGVLLLYLNVQGLVGVATVEERLARRLLGPDDLRLMALRIAELSTSRAGIVAAVDAERRRIERDLHDGVQQRLVALGMLLGRARRAGRSDKAEALVRQAHEQSQHLLDELREVAWRVYPTALDSLGLEEALAQVADRGGVPVRMDYALPERPPSVVETAAYFVVCEAVTNAAKHSGARSISVRVARRGSMVVVRISDDGRGGADPSGGGLSGLARRVAALDGVFHVDSPPGGPTTITAELPCA